jgi:general secretion pathway protein F
VPLFEYKAITPEGRTMKGVVDAESPKAARLKLRKQGVFATEVFEGKAERAKAAAGTKVSALANLNLSDMFTRISPQDISVMTRQLSTLLGAGLPLIESLNALIEQVDNMKLKRVLSDVKDRVNEGKSLADAMRMSSRSFNDLFVNMIRAGESSGTLEIVLQRLADYLEGQVKLRNKIYATMTYPVIMLALMVGVIAILFIFVIPKITKIFEETNQALPVYTEILITGSEFAKNYWWAIGLLFAAAFWMFRRWVATEKGRYKFDRFKLRMPLFGKLVLMVAISRFSKTLSTLLSSGVNVLMSLDIVKNIVGNKIIEEAITNARESISEGATISDPLRKSGIFPPIVIHMVAIGEKSGELEGMLLKVSEAYDNEVESIITGLTAMLEPIMIVLMAGIVFFMMISILMPLFQMNNMVM